MYAVMLRDLRTRFFGHGLGYLVAFAWPLGHVGILVIIRTLQARESPYGESTPVFFATGLVPFFAFLYMSRFIMFTVVLNASMLRLPAVKPIDLLLGRAVLETLTACLVMLTVMGALWLCGIDSADLLPRDLLQASYAFGAALLLGLGFGLVNAAIAMVMPLWMAASILVSLVIYLTSGIIFVPDQLPERAREILAYHPMLQVIEWMRSAYYDGIGDGILSRTYTLSWGFGCVFVGLLLERLMRGRAH